MPTQTPSKKMNSSTSTTKVKGGLKIAPKPRPTPSPRASVSPPPASPPPRDASSPPPADDDESSVASPPPADDDASSVASASPPPVMEVIDAEDIAEVKAILNGDGDTVILNRRQLDIAYKIEKGDKKVRAKKASFAKACKFDAEFFLEIQSKYRQDNGKAYTLQAFQNAIDYWFFEHMNKGNAFARSKQYKFNDKGKVIGLMMPQSFWDNDFLCGFLNTPEGVSQLKRGQESQDAKKKSDGNAKATNTTVEGRKRNVDDAIKKMGKEERDAMIKALMEMA